MLKGLGGELLARCLGEGYAFEPPFVCTFALGMQGMLFWSGQIVGDIAFSVLTLGLLLMGIVAYRVPGLVRLVMEAIVYQREQLFFVQVHRDIPCWFFRVVGRVLSAMLLALTSFIYLDREGFWLEKGPFYMVVGYLGILGALLLFFWGRRILYRFLGWVYLQPRVYEEWASGYALLEWIWSLPLYIAIILELREDTFMVGAWLSLGAFLLWRLLLLRRTLPLLRAQGVSYMLLSLYLCAHEIVPFVLLFWALFRG